MFDNLFPKYQDELKIIVLEIDGKIEGSCSVWIKHINRDIRIANIDTIMINPE